MRPRSVRVMDEILKQLAALEGGADLVASLRAELKSATDTQAAEFSATKKALSAAEKARDKALADLDAAGKTTDEQVAQHKAAAEAAQQALAEREAEHKAYRINTAVASKLGIGDEAKRAAALKLGDWSALDLDDKGEVVGADAAIKALQEAHGYLFAAPEPAAKGFGGPAFGSQGRPASGTVNQDQADYAAGRAAAMSTLGIPAQRAQE